MIPSKSGKSVGHIPQAFLVLQIQAVHDVVGAVAGHHAQLDLVISSSEPWSKIEILMLKFHAKGYKLYLLIPACCFCNIVKPR